MLACFCGGEVSCSLSNQLLLCPAVRHDLCMLMLVVLVVNREWIHAVNVFDDYFVTSSIEISLKIFVGAD